MNIYESVNDQIALVNELNDLQTDSLSNITASVSPFSTWLWISIGGSIFVFTVVTLFVSMLVRYMYKIF